MTKPANKHHRWISTAVMLPSLKEYGGKQVMVRYIDGSESLEVYQGRGLFGTGFDAMHKATHWKPA